MANKTVKKTINWVMWLIGLIVTIGVGGLFINGSFLNVVILKWLPVVVHQIAGWVIVIGAIVGAAMKLME